MRRLFPWLTVISCFACAIFAHLWFQQRRDIAALEDQTKNLREQVRRFIREHDAAANEVEALTKENSKLKNTSADQASTDPTSEALNSWLTRVSLLRHRFDEHPDQRIPELKLATDQDWLNVAKANLDTDEDYRRAMASLRAIVEAQFLGNVMQPALRKYSNANSGQFPTDLSQLQPYLENPDDSSILRQYEMVPAWVVPNMKLGGTQIITPKAVIDDAYDSTLVASSNGMGTTGSPPSLILTVVNAYLAANNASEPTDPSQLLPYATTPDQQTAVQKAIQRMTPK